MWRFGWREGGPAFLNGIARTDFLNSIAREEPPVALSARRDRADWTSRASDNVNKWHLRWTRGLSDDPPNCHFDRAKRVEKSLAGKSSMTLVRRSRAFVRARLSEQHCSRGATFDIACP